MVLQLLRFADGDVWEPGNGLEFTPCMDPAPSFRCRKCDADQNPCLLPWADMQPFEFPMDPVAEFPLALDPGAEGIDVEIDLPADAVPWLIDTGVMLVPAPQVLPDAVAVTTLEAAPQLGPQLSILYCPPLP